MSKNQQKLYRKSESVECVAFTVLCFLPQSYLMPEAATTFPMKISTT